MSHQPVVHSGDAPTSQDLSGATSDGQLIDIWLRGKSANTREAYRRDVSQFFDFFQGGVHYVRLVDIWAWTDSLVNEGRTQSTIARKLASLKSLFSFGHRVGYLSVNVGAAAILPKVPQRLSEKILSEEAVAKILAAHTSNRDRVLLQLFYASGARVSELAALRWRDVVNRRTGFDGLSGQITVTGKGSKTRSILLSSKVARSLEGLKSEEIAAGFGRQTDAVLRSQKGGALSRQQLWRIVKSAAQRAGLPEAVSPHWLRHAHASHALDRGAPAHLVKETLGHESLATTSKYTHARPGDSSTRYLDV